MEKINGFEYMQFSLEQKVEFYFGTFFEQIMIDNYDMKKVENEIKQHIFNELDSFEFNLLGCQISKDRHSLGVKKMLSELGHLTNNWSIDWEWILHHIILDYVNIGKALNLISNSNKDEIQVYKYLPENYYDFARKLYLKDLKTKQPRVFDLKKILLNGHGLKSGIKKFVPLVGVTLWNGFDNNFWDLTELRVVPKRYEWNDENHRFGLPRNWERKVVRKSKVKITIGEKTFYV